MSGVAMAARLFLYLRLSSLRGRLTCEMRGNQQTFLSYQHTPERHRVGSSNIATSGLFVCCTLHIQISLHFCLKSDVWDHFVSVCLCEEAEKFRQICFLWHFPFIFFIFFTIQQWATISMTKLWPGDALPMNSGEVHDGNESRLRNISSLFSIYINYCEELSFFLSSFVQTCAWCLQRYSWPSTSFPTHPTAAAPPHTPASL